MYSASKPITFFGAFSIPCPSILQRRRQEAYGWHTACYLHATGAPAAQDSIQIPSIPIFRHAAGVAPAWGRRGVPEEFLSKTL